MIAPTTSDPFLPPPQPLSKCTIAQFDYASKILRQRLTPFQTSIAVETFRTVVSCHQEDSAISCRPRGSDEILTQSCRKTHHLGPASTLVDPNWLKFAAFRTNSGYFPGQGFPAHCGRPSRLVIFPRRACYLRSDSGDTTLSPSFPWI
jgi:hypothetical protein